MDNIKTLAYAGLGLAIQTNDKVKAQFNDLVDLGKKEDLEGKNIIGDFFKTVDSTKEDLETQFDKNKTKLYDSIPLLKELEDKMNERSEEVKSTIKETISKAKNNFNNTTSDENVTSENESETANAVEDAEIVSEETK
jgi:polyhydroxyalkanoate synthesis regulator phasin